MTLTGVGLYGQCSNNNTFLADLTPSYSGDTVIHPCIQAGQYITTQVSVGNIYLFSTCGQNSFNTQMTLRNSSGTVWYAFNDNFCAQQSQINWTATYTGTVRLLIDESPGCGHNSICQQILVSQSCQADAGTVSAFKNGSPALSPIYLCEGEDTLNLFSNNDYTLPIADSGEVSELMYMAFTCLPTHSNPLLDSCYTGVIFKNKNILETNPGLLPTGVRYFIAPVTVDDGDNGLNPNGMVNLDNNGDSCYALGTAIEVVYLSPLAFASNLDCGNKAVVVNIFGGKPEYDSSNYTIVNTGAGTLSSSPVSQGGAVTIGNLENGDFYSFDVSDNNGCTSSFSGGPLSVPDAGDDTTLSFCITDASVKLDTFINGSHDTTGQWYNPLGAPSSGLFVPGTSAAGTWKYVINGFSVCDDDTSFMEVIIDSLFEAGNNSSSIVCQYDSIQDFWDKLSVNADLNGTWFLPNGNPFINPINYGNYYIPSRTYKYLVNINSACPRDSSRHIMNMRKFPIPGGDTSTIHCSNENPFNLTSRLAGNPDTNGSWFGPSMNSRAANFDPGIDSSGLYTYTVYGLSPCPDTSSHLTIQISQAPNPGLGSSYSFCRNDSMLDLNALLTGNPDSNGIWMYPNNDTISSSIIDPTSSMSGTYKHVILGVSPCEDSSAQLVINFVDPPNPGLNDSIMLCSSQSPLNLFDTISNNPDLGGAWFDPLMNPFSGVFFPDSSQDGIYTYTSTGNSPCADSSSYHHVTTVLAPNPGIDSTIKFCGNDDPLDLINVIGGLPDSGGTWHDPFNNVFPMPYLPSLHVQGNYEYRLNGMAPCSQASSYINVATFTPPNPGSGTSVLFCSSDSVQNLFSYLTGGPDSIGTWLDSLNNVVSGTFYPSINPSGTYTYVVNGISPCSDSSSSLQVTVYSALNPGISGLASICSNNTGNLINLLSGSPDTIGYWKNPSGFTHNGIIDPAVDSSGIYKYVLAGVGTCMDTSSTLNITIVSAPNPGIGDTLEVCSNDNVQLLFPYLGLNPDSNGTWSNPLLQPFNGLFNPSTDTAGIYTYTINGNSPCLDSNAYVLINKTNFVSAGVNGSITVCESDSAFNLMTVLGGNPHFGGTWKNINQLTIGTIFNPLIDSSQVVSYTVFGTGPCSDSTAYAQVSVVDNVNPGEDSLIKFCNNMSPVNLFNFISNNPTLGGIWTNPSQSNFNGILNPATDSSGFYSYTVQGQFPCVDKSSFLEVEINSLYTAGSDANLTICQDDPPFNFFNKLNGDPDIYGIWLSPLDSTFDGISSSINLIEGSYKYLIKNKEPCPSDSSIVTLTIRQAPNAGDGMNLSLCEVDNAVDLFKQIDNHPDSNGIWLSPLLTSFYGQFDPSVHNPGKYLYIVSGNHPCTDDSTTVNVKVLQLPNAGNDQNLTVCWNQEVNLLNLLDSSSDKNGIWLAPNKTTRSSIFNGATGSPGAYYYVSPGNSVCPGDTIMAKIEIVEEFEIYAGPDVYLRTGQKKQLNVSSFDALSFDWKPTIGLSDPGVSNPKVFTEVTTDYVVTGTDRFGCKNSDSLKVTVLPKILIPNSFTPNGDGLNDAWFVEGLYKYPTSTVFVFTEDNYEVYKSSDPYDRWDGTYEGKVLPLGTYIYVIKFDDEAQFNTIYGKLTLLR